MPFALIGGANPQSPWLIRKHSNIYCRSLFSGREILKISFSNTEARFGGGKSPTLARSALKMSVVSEFWPSIECRCRNNLSWLRRLAERKS